MRSIAIIRAADILKLRSTLVEMSRIGIDFEGEPKEINPGAVEKILSRTAGAPNKSCEFCALVPLVQDYGSFRSKMKSIVLYSDVLVLDSSQELFEKFARLIPVLPDLVLPSLRYKDMDKQTGASKGKPSAVYLGVFINRKVQVQIGSGTIYTGILRHADSIGVFFEPSDNSAPLFITWHDIKKVIIPKEDK